MKISLQQALAKLPLPASSKWPQGVCDVEVFQRAGLSLEIFAPKDNDYQTPHAQDELYIVARGSGTLLLDDNPIEFETGDVLFVAARRPHRFVRYTADMALWVVFWGPRHEG